MLRRAWQLELDAGTMALPPLPDLPAFLSVAPRRETAAALS
jgi:hypothetical protein